MSPACVVGLSNGAMGPGKRVPRAGGPLLFVPGPRRTHAPCKYARTWERSRRKSFLSWERAKDRRSYADYPSRCRIMDPRRIERPFLGLPYT
jgi:hypothetical protein